MGPALLRAGQALDVRPHPHIGLATVTYLFDGKIRHRDSLGTEMVIAPGDEIVVSSEAGAHFMLFGGASLGSKRYIWWNFVSSSKERIEQAKEEWKTGRFDIVPGDDKEFIPLPEA